LNAPEKYRRAGELRRMVVTLGSQGAVYADADGSSGVIPALKVDVVDTTGAGDAFFAGVAIGLTYHKTIGEACVIGTRLAASVIASQQNVCPRFRPEEFGILTEK
jgi:pseudouridine kinase